MTTTIKNHDEILSYKTLLQVLSKKLNKNIIDATYQLQKLHGGTVGQVHLVTGFATSDNQMIEPYQLVLKKQIKWERYGDLNSWRREFDLYNSDLSQTFSNDFAWPDCYKAVMSNNSFELWMDYIEAPSGQDLTLEMYERAAEVLGSFHGSLCLNELAEIKKIDNLSSRDYVKNFYLHYSGWDEVYDYIRSDVCDLPNEICQMMIYLDDNHQGIIEQLDRTPIVFSHRDYWNTNIFYDKNRIITIDWDTAGYGYFGEDIASLIADGTEPRNMLDYFRLCVPAYVKGFSQYLDINFDPFKLVHNIILMMFGYRLIESYKFAENPEDRILAKKSLQSILEMKNYF